MSQTLPPILDNLSNLQWSALLAFSVLLLGAFAVALLSGLMAKKRGFSLAHLRAKPIMTANELEFFGRLCRALPDHHVFPQVSLDALIAVSSKASYAARIALRNSYSQKRPDFVICRPETLSVVAIIELDDASHNTNNDRKRDAIIGAAGYRVVRFWSKAKPSEGEIYSIIAAGSEASRS